MTTPPAKPIPSPCVQVCCLDEADICIGCYRSVNEITEWSSYSNEQKRAVLELTNQRYQDKYSND